MKKLLMLAIIATLGSHIIEAKQLPDIHAPLTKDDLMRFMSIQKKFDPLVRRCMNSSDDGENFQYSLACENFAKLFRTVVMEDSLYYCDDYKIEMLKRLNANIPIFEKQHKEYRILLSAYDDYRIEMLKRLDDDVQIFEKLHQEYVIPFVDKLSVTKDDLILRDSLGLRLDQWMHLCHGVKHEGKNIEYNVACKNLATLLESIDDNDDVFGIIKHMIIDSK